MAKIITVIGNIGVGKTTLTRVLAREFGWINCSEQHVERPFQALMSQNSHFALANQIDYLLLRAEQEAGIRSGITTGIFDGGLDMDFHIFTRLFQENGYLDQDEFELCHRFYKFARAKLPHPDLVIEIKAQQDVVEQRYLSRDRINIAKVNDMREINVLLENYRGLNLSENTLEFDVTASDPDFPEIVQKIKESDLNL